MSRRVLARMMDRRAGNVQVRTHTADAAAAGHAQPLDAAALVIGDEILSGAIQDTNTPWLAKLLHSQGADMLRFEYVPDNKQVIVDTLQRLKQTVGPNGVIFTSGGIGPTHDDVTYESVAACFGKECSLHEPTLQRMREHYSKRGLELNAARQRMATLPQGCRVHYTDGLHPHWVPLVEIEKVFILPGIPKLYKAMITAQQARFVGVRHHTEELHSDKGEGDVADLLRKLAAEHPKVHIGSYPSVDAQAAHNLKVVVSGRDAQLVQDAASAIRQVI